MKLKNITASIFALGLLAIGHTSATVRHTHKQVSYGLAQTLIGTSLRNDGWTVIGNRTGKAGAGSLNSTYSVWTDRMEVVSPWSGSALQTVRGSWYVGTYAESCFPNDLLCKDWWVGQGASYPSAGSTDYGLQFTYANSPLGILRHGSVLTSDTLNVGVTAGSRFFIHTSQSSAVPVGPSNPTLATSSSPSSSFSATQKVYVAIAYVYPNGMESLPSGGVLATIPTNSYSVQVTSPTAVSGAIGYSVYVNTSSATGQSVAYYDSQCGVVPFGVTANIINSPANTGALRSVFMPSTLGTAPTAGLMTRSGSTMGGTGAGAANDGEGQTFGLDYSAPGSLISASRTTNLVRPDAVLLKCPDGVHPSVALVGDSIELNTADGGFAYGYGGYIERALAGQVNQYAYDASITPLYGRLSVATGGETAATWASQSAQRRYQLASLCTHAFINLGTNDCGIASSNGGSAVIAANLLTVHNKFLIQGMYTWQFTILPRTGTTDFYATTTNQTVVGTHEADRRAVNNWIVDTTGATTVTDENMFRAVGTYTPATSPTPTGGGDGTTTTFTTAYPFATATETIKVNGVAISKSPLTAYAYTKTATIGGITYASGVIFTSAPTSGYSVTATYTKCPGMALCLNNSKFQAVDLTVPAGIELNAAGSVAFGGGYCRLQGNTVLTISSNVSAVGASSVTMTGTAYTQDQYRGYALAVVTDSGNSAAVGQINPIMYNTATVFTLLNTWASTPSTSATFKVIELPRQSDGGAIPWSGIHPTSYDHLKLAQTLYNKLIASPLQWP